MSGNRVFRSQPKEPEWHCWVKKKNGKLCGQPAVGIDHRRGLVVCEQHMAEQLAELRQPRRKLQAA